VRAINNNSMALDLYCWLAYRLHVLTVPRAVTWKALWLSFGTAYQGAISFQTAIPRKLAFSACGLSTCKRQRRRAWLGFKAVPPPVAPKQSMSATRLVGSS